MRKKRCTQETKFGTNFKLTTHISDDTIVSRFSSLSGKPYANEAVSTPILFPFNRGLFLTCNHAAFTWLNVCIGLVAASICLNFLLRKPSGLRKLSKESLLTPPFALSLSKGDFNLMIFNR